MTHRNVLLALLLLGPLAACDKKEETQAGAVVQQAPVDEEKRITRPEPARSGMSSDPDNPSGAPGTSRVGTSGTRY
jgi:hypothetical protein